MQFDDETISEYRGHGFVQEVGESKSVEPDQYNYTIEPNNECYNVVRYKDDNSYKTILFKANTERAAKEYLESLKFITGTK